MQGQPEAPGQEQDVLAGQVMEDVGVGEPSVDEAGMPAASPEDDLPLYAKEKIGKIQKRHQRDMRQMQRQLQELQGRLSPQQQESSMSQSPYGQPQAGQSGDDGTIQRAVEAALRAREDQERQAFEQQQKEHIRKQYQTLQQQLDSAADKYDDFDDVVRSEDAPYTNQMRDMALLLPNSADVLYKLGKNREELKRIANLHPLEQAREMVKLSMALQGGDSSTKNVGQAPKPLGQIKSNPPSPRKITKDTPVSEIRRMLRQGKGWSGMTRSGTL